MIAIQDKTYFEIDGYNLKNVVINVLQMKRILGTRF